MAASDEPLRPETRALEAMIQAAMASTPADGAAREALLFLGNWHQAVPAVLIQDPVLEPVDKVVWMAIMLCARDAQGRAAFPDYDTLARTANVASPATIARALAILRLTRWLTQCTPGRPTSGRFTRNVYLLHDEPLPLLDALYLDQVYLPFVQDAQQHHHARVRQVAQAVCAGLDLDVGSGRDLGQVESVLERRVQAAQLLSSIDQNQNQNQNQIRDGRYFTFPAAVIAGLHRSAQTMPAGAESDPQNLTVGNRLQNLKAVKFTRGGSSSCSLKKYYKNTTTTTTTVNSARARGDSAGPDVPVPDSPALIYPPRLSDNQRVLADRYLATVAADTRQTILDELQGRLASEHKGMPPVYDELRFLHSLCKLAQQGQFIPNLGIKVAEARRERAQHVPPPPGEPPQPQQLEARSRAKEFGIEQLAKLRQSLGMPVPPDDP